MRAPGPPVGGRAAAVSSVVAPASSRTTDKPTADDMAVAKQNILSTRPDAPLRGERRPRRQGRLPRPRRRSAADRAGQGRHAHALLEGRRRARRRLEDVHARRGRRASRATSTPTTRRSRASTRSSAWKAGDIIRDVHTVRLPARLEQADGRGLRRPLAGRRPGCRSRAGPHDDEGRVLAASIPVRAAGRAPSRASATWRAWSTKAPKLDGKLDDAAWAAAPSTGAVRQHDDRRAGAAEDRGQAALGQEVPLRRRSTTPTTTSGRTSTSATTSCGPRRPTS